MSESSLFLAADKSSSPRLIDGFSLLHLSFGIIIGSCFLVLKVIWWASLLAVAALAITWELLEYRFSSIIKPFFGLNASEQDSKLNMVGDVVCALAGFGLSVAIPWPANILTGTGVLFLGILWSVCRVKKNRTRVQL
ncbi:MAG TPA: hypothetical protein DCW74_18995 [Alteromonas australica]|uniref:Uncharacterized protein n=1 Tax=Alteromonas australica TaxID=589873 RepID=A0A350P941_9ALTE|nr:hypothetical protein [Alteromonas australica]